MKSGQNIYIGKVLVGAIEKAFDVDLRYANMITITIQPDYATTIDVILYAVETVEQELIGALEALPTTKYRLVEVEEGKQDG